MHANKPTPKRVGNYDLVRLLGQGGMGTVYLGEHPEIGRRVAIKLISPEIAHHPHSEQRFIAEARAVSRIHHPGVVEIYDFGRTAEGELYCVMELLEGRELSAIMKETGSMSCGEALPYIEQICAALQAAHNQGVVHRDLKPENIFVTSTAPVKIKLLDFGLAKLLEGSAPGMTMTSSGMVMGSPMTIAPEQAAGDIQAIGPHTDRYSLGAVIFWMLAGRPPFLGEAPLVVVAKHVTEAPDALKKLCPLLPDCAVAIVEQCLAKAPAQRPANTQLIAEAMNRAAQIEAETRAKLAEVPTQAPAIQRTPESGSRFPTTLREATGETSSSFQNQIKPRGTQLIFGALAVVLAIAGGLYWMAQPTATRAQPPPLKMATAPQLKSNIAKPKATEMPAKVTVPRVKDFAIKVVGADLVNANCVLRLADTVIGPKPLPCLFMAKKGSPIVLEVQRRGLKAAMQRWNLDADRQLYATISRNRKAIVLSETVTGFAAPATIGTRASRVIVHPPPHRERTKTATASEAAPTPVNPVTPTAPRRRRIGESTMEF